MGYGYGGDSGHMGGGLFGGNSSFIIFLVLILLLFGSGGYGSYGAEK